MRTITYRLKDFENEKVTITIGFVGENDHTVVRVDCSEAYAEYPDAIASLAVSPPRGDSYPVVVNVNGEYVEWTIKNSDVVYHGNGEAQLTFIQDNVVKKEYSFYTKILKSIAPEGSAPTSIQAWIDAANEALGTIEGAVQDAESAKDAAVVAQGKAEEAEENAKGLFPTAPGTDGDYFLKATFSGSSATYTWEQISPLSEVTF